MNQEIKSAEEILQEHTGVEVQYLHSKNRIIMAIHEYHNQFEISVNKVENAITYEQVLTLPWYWGEDNGKAFTHLYKPGYDNINGNYNYFGTSKRGMRIISVNASYAGHTYVEILCDGGTRKGFNGHVRSFEELKLINSLVL
jgi:hypothetical protein